MKLSDVVASAEAPPSAFVVWRGFEVSIGKAAKLGYHAIELALKDVSDVDPGRLRHWLDRDGLEASCRTWSCSTRSTRSLTTVTISAQPTCSTLYY